MEALAVARLALCAASLPIRGRVGWSIWLGGTVLLVGAWLYG